jgi:hypothetical protein
MKEYNGIGGIKLFYFLLPAQATRDFSSASYSRTVCFAAH